MEYNLENLPYLTIVKYFDEEYIGIVSNSDSLTTSFYPILDTMDKKMVKLFCDLGQLWWWETNRKYPISLALKNQWKIFQPYIINFITKDLKYIQGRPFYSIDDTFIKKTKRKHITLRR